MSCVEHSFPVSCESRLRTEAGDRMIFTCHNCLAIKVEFFLYQEGGSRIEKTKIVQPPQGL